MIRRALPKPTVEFGPHDLVAGHPRERGFTGTRLTTPPSPYATRRQNLSSRYRFHDSDPVVHDSAAANVAAAYNQAGGNYVAYADGDPTAPVCF